MTDPQLVRCQYSQDPHPVDDECVDVTDAWPDDVLEAGLRRVLTAIDGYPPKPAVHASHQPEDPGAELLPGHTACKVCCQFVAHHGCASPRGITPCAGPGRIELREGA